MRMKIAAWLAPLSMALLAGCEGQIIEGPTTVDMETFAAKVKGAGSPEAACKELGQLCTGQNLGCTAFEHFCGDVFAAACDKLITRSEGARPYDLKLGCRSPSSASTISRAVCAMRVPPRSSASSKLPAVPRQPSSSTPVRISKRSSGG